MYSSNHRCTWTNKESCKVIGFDTSTLGTFTFTVTAISNVKNLGAFDTISSTMTVDVVDCAGGETLSLLDSTPVTVVEKVRGSPIVS